MLLLHAPFVKVKANGEQQFFVVTFDFSMLRSHSTQARKTGTMIKANAVRALSEALKTNTTLQTLNLEREQEEVVKMDELQTSSLTNKQGTALVMKEQSHWAKHWRSTQQWQHWNLNVSKKKVGKINELQTVSTTNTNKQAAVWKLKKQEHWARQWKQTQHFNHSIWDVSKKKVMKIDEWQILPTTHTNK